MTIRGTYAVIGLFLGAVAFVGFAALVEHVTQLKEAEWLRHIFPFGIATDPMWLSVVSISALAASVLLLRAAKSS
jgi:hypothetical protein